MRVSVEQLKDGCIVDQDIFLTSGKPFMMKDTVLNSDLITVLRKFFIQNIEIKPVLENGEKFLLSTAISKEFVKKATIENGVKEVSILFNKVSSGLPLHFPDIRKAVGPIIEYLKNDEQTYGYSLGSDNKDKFIEENMVTSAILCFKVGQALKYDYQDCVQLAYAGLLSNLGLIKIDKKIIAKLNQLSNKEREEYQKHPTYSYTLIQKMDYLKPETKVAILQHHELLDGSGYPFKLKAEKIHQYSQITAISELFVELTSQTPFQDPHTFIQAINLIKEAKHQKFSFTVVDAFLKVVYPIHNNASVLLSDGSEGKVIFVNQNNITEPIVQVRNQTIDLSKQKQLEIIKIY